MSKAIDYCKNVFDGTHDSPKPCDSGYKLLTSKNILNGYLDKEDAYFISSQDYEAINKRSKIKKWDILFSMIGSVGNICIITDEEIDFAIKNMGVFSCDDEYKAKWLYFYLQSPYVKKVIQNFLNGAVQKFLSLSMLRDFEIPDYNESKKKIVDLLWCIEEKISNCRKINEELDKTITDVYNYWFLQLEFPFNNGRSYKSNNGLMKKEKNTDSLIPVKWKYLKIKDCIAHINTGLNPRSNFHLGKGDIKYVTVKNLTKSGVIDFSDCDVIDEKAKEIVHNRSDIRKEDILFASIAPLGRCCIIQENPKDWDINESVFSIRVNPEIMTPEYLYMFFISHYFIKKAEHSSTGSIFSGIRINTLEQMDILVPDIDTLNAFSKEAKTMFYKKYLNEKEIESLFQLKKLILPLLMNGQVSINE